MRRRVVITGTGLVSCRGEGVAPHLDAVRTGAPPPVAPERHTGEPVHPAPALDWDRQIPKKSDQRQMEPWQRLGCYAAGMALDAAGMKDDPGLKSRTQLIVASGGGERDYAVDGRILTGLRDAAEPGAFLNERLQSDLRPTLFLAQLSNLLAGNISIVHGVTGASRTFMGEEQCGVDALRIAEARIAAGQADIILVGGSYNAERPDVLLVHGMGGFTWRGDFRPVFERPAAGGGYLLGSGAAFLVLEAEEHARERGAAFRACLDPVGATRSRRGPGEVGRAIAAMWAAAVPNPPPIVLSGATGVAGPTEDEWAALGRLAPGARLQATGDLVGHMLEAQAPAAAALAAALVEAGLATSVVATATGHRRGEGLIRVTGVA